MIDDPAMVKTIHGRIEIKRTCLNMLFEEIGGLQKLISDAEVRLKKLNSAYVKMMNLDVEDLAMPLEDMSE